MIDPYSAQSEPNFLEELAQVVRAIAERMSAADRARLEALLSPEATSRSEGPGGPAQPLTGASEPAPATIIAPGAVTSEAIADGAVTADKLDPSIPLGDTTPPAAPTGLVLASSLAQQPDGSLSPQITATWARNAEADMDRYEIELVEALRGTVAFAASASGTGGSLPAGDYNVRVTGLGIDGGETQRSGVATVTVAAGQRLYVTITAKAGCSSYRIYASRDAEPKLALTTTVTGAPVEVSAEGAGGVAPTSSTALAYLAPRSFSVGQPPPGTQPGIAIAPVAGKTYHGLRVRAIDHSNNRSGWTTGTITSVADVDAPAIPSGLTASGGFRLIGASWARNTEADLDRYEIRYSPQLGAGPDPGAWQIESIRGTIAIISGLAPDTVYYVQVRAIDRSNNVRTSYTDPTPVDADANPDAGWSNDGVNAPYVTATPTLVGAADVAFNSVVTRLLSAGLISADVIDSGTIIVGGDPNRPDVFIARDAAGVELLRIDQYGLIARDPSSNKAIRYWKGILQFTSNYNASNPNASTWTTAISADGIVADTIKTGSLAGGHNSIPNSGFELSAFTTWFSKVWTSQTDWSGYITGTAINVTAAADGTLQLTAYT
jgi:hypothetical protein